MVWFSNFFYFLCYISSHAYCFLRLLQANIHKLAILLFFSCFSLFPSTLFLPDICCFPAGAFCFFCFHSSICRFHFFRFPLFACAFCFPISVCAFCPCTVCFFLCFFFLLLAACFLQPLVGFFQYGKLGVCGRLYTVSNLARLPSFCPTSIPLSLSSFIPPCRTLASPFSRVAVLP